MVCKHVQLEHEMSMQNNMSYSMMNGQSPQTPQEDYQDPKNRYGCPSVPQQRLLLYAGAAVSTMRLTMLQAALAFG